MWAFDIWFMTSLNEAYLVAERQSWQAELDLS
jgi:hypothetical protein